MSEGCNHDCGNCTQNCPSRQMKPEEQEKYLAVGKALFASAFAPAAPAQDDDAAE